MKTLVTFHEILVCLNGDLFLVAYCVPYKTGYDFIPYHQTTENQGPLVTVSRPFGTSAASWFNGSPGFGSKKRYLPENTLKIPERPETLKASV